MKSSEILMKLWSFRQSGYRLKDEKMRISPLPHYLQEIIEMGACLYFAENAVDKPKNITFETVDPSRWKDSTEYLQRLFDFLTDRYIEINFEEVKRGRDSELEEIRGKYGVSLFSGGADSYCGSWHLLDKNYNVCLVHTSTSKKMQSIARRVFENFPQDKSFLYEMSDQFIQGQTSPLYPQLRSTLFLMNSVPLMEKFDVSEVFIPENGFMMINPPVSELVVFTKATRPEVLFFCQTIFSDYLRKNISILSPFYKNTKSEILANYVKRKGIDQTFSCFNYRWGKRKNMCGTCYGCNITRLSMLALSEKESENRYEANPFFLESTPSNEKSRNKLFQYSDFLDMCEKFVLERNLDPELIDLFDDIQKCYAELGYQVDIPELMKRFGLDMFVGLRNMFSFSQRIPEHTVLGKKFFRIVKDSELTKDIESRSEELIRIKEK